MADLLSGSADTPLAALQRQQPFWRYTAFVQFQTGPGTDVSYWYLGNITPAALAVGPQSWIDAYRVWYVPPGNPQVAYWQDVSIRAPITSPIDFYRQSAVLTGGSTVAPGLYVYPATRSYADTFGGVAANTPLAPRTVNNSTVLTDLLVYFQRPDQIGQQRAPLVNASYAQAPITEQYYRDGVLLLDGATPITVFDIPTYGRRRTAMSFVTGQTMDWFVYGQINQMHGSGAGGQTRIIDSGTTTSAVAESFVLNTAEYDRVTLYAQASSGDGANVSFAFEATDD